MIRSDSRLSGRAPDLLRISLSGYEVMLKGRWLSSRMTILDGREVIVDGGVWLLSGQEISRFSQAQPRKTLKKMKQV